MRKTTVSPEVRAKISHALMGRKKSFETRQKMSKAKKEEWRRAKEFANHTTMPQLLGKNNNNEKEENEKEI